MGSRRGGGRVQGDLCERPGRECRLRSGVLGDRNGGTSVEKCRAQKKQISSGQEARFSLCGRLLFSLISFSQLFCTTDLSCSGPFRAFHGPLPLLSFPPDTFRSPRSSISLNSWYVCMYVCAVFLLEPPRCSCIAGRVELHAGEGENIVAQGSSQEFDHVQARQSQCLSRTQIPYPNHTPAPTLPQNWATLPH
ncbi:hypothetical protein EV426DRAFT_606985 [Tirmania nivea]|nr:hypothetical protein EV426DRAFT_606985 [Tirmania nivea]